MASVYLPRFVDDLRGLEETERRLALAAVRRIEAAPHPDGLIKRLPPPGAMLKAGTITASLDGFAFRYTIGADGAVVFFRCFRVVDLPPAPP